MKKYYNLRARFFILHSREAKDLCFLQAFSKSKIKIRLLANFQSDLNSCCEHRSFLLILSLTSILMIKDAMKVSVKIIKIIAWTVLLTISLMNIHARLHPL